MVKGEEEIIKTEESPELGRDLLELDDEGCDSSLLSTSQLCFLTTPPRSDVLRQTPVFNSTQASVQYSNES